MSDRKYKKNQVVYYWNWSPLVFKPYVGECTVLEYPKDYAGPVCLVRLDNNLTLIKGESCLFETREAATSALIDHIRWHICRWNGDIEECRKQISNRKKWIKEAENSIIELMSYTQ